MEAVAKKVDGIWSGAHVTGSVERECIWEREMINAGQLIYEQSNYKASGQAKDASETATGMKLIKKNLLSVMEVFEAEKKKLVRRPRTRKEYKATIVALPSDACLSLGLKALIDSCYRGEQELTKLQSVCFLIGKSCETELNFRHWIAASKNSAKEWAKERGMSSTPQSLAERMLKEYGVDAARIRKWRKTFTELNEYEWDKQHRLFVGEFIVRSVVKAMPEYFEILEVRRGPQTVYHVALTDAGKAKFEQSEANIAASRYIKLPMLSKPVRWTKED